MCIVLRTWEPQSAKRVSWSAASVGYKSKVPTLAESGFPGFDMNDWNGLFAGAGTPRAVVDRMAAVAAVSAKSAAVRARMDPAGAIMIGNAPDVFARWLTEQRQGAIEVIRDAGITLG